MNPFDLLVDDDNDDPSHLIAKLPAPVASATKKPAAAAKPAAKLPSKPLLPAQAGKFLLLLLFELEIVIVMHYDLVIYL